MELVKPVVSSVANTVANPILNPILEHVKYPFTAGDNTKALQSATEKLQAQRDDVKLMITNAEQENGIPTKEADLWLARVTTIEGEASHIQQEYRQLRRCLCNICPNVWSVYKTSKMAANKLVEVKSLSEEKPKPESIIHKKPPPLGQVMPASSSISPYLNPALDCVNNDGYNIIGIWGMGGVGKTHLLQQINEELSKNHDKNHAFEVRVFVTCSKECSEEKVQNEIIDRLRLDKNGSMEQKQSTICNFLKERSFVLLLDDLWDRVDLDKIGIPDPTSAVGACKRKVVLTTRSTEVCGQMEVKKRLRVDVLNWDDAWSLFKEKVTEETINSDPLIQKNSVDVAKELGGLPLALITIGRAMHDKMDPCEWEDALEKLKQARLNDVEFSDPDQSVFHKLRFSYDSLKDDALKQCFLHCSLWPEDHPIPKNDLVELWMGLGLINESSIQAAYDVGYSYISRLQAVCLLEIGTMDGVIRDLLDDAIRDLLYDAIRDLFDGTNGVEIIKMHDVIRDMALWIANNQGKDPNKWIVQAATFDKAQEVKIFPSTEKISVMNKKKFSILRVFNYERNVSFVTGSSTKLSTLFLSHNGLINSTTLRLELFSTLTFLNLSNNKFKLFPVEICKLVYLEYLNLSQNALESLPEELANLTNLKYLLLKGIECTFPNKVLSKLKVLRVLDLSDCYPGDYLEIFPTLEEDLQCLPNFQALGITICSIPVLEKFAQTVSVPVRWLVCSSEADCLSLSSYFLGNSELQSNLHSLELKICVSVEYVKFESTSKDQNICHFERLELLRFVEMISLEKVIWKNLDPKDVFPRLRYLEFNFCLHLVSVSWVLNLPCIRKLKVIECINIKQLICIDELKNDGINVSQYSVPFLKKIILNSNSSLESISDRIVTFPSLEILEVYNCDKLRKLPFNTSDPPRTLKKIIGAENWWNNVEMGDVSHKSSLNTFFSKLW